MSSRLPLLPPELWIACAEFLPISDLRNFSRVCKQFRDIAWLPLFRQLQTRPVNLPCIPKEIINAARHISLVELDAERYETDDDVYEPLRSFPRLTSLKFEGLDNFLPPLEDINALCSIIKCMSIDTIYVVLCNDMFFEGSASKLQPLPAMKTFHLSWEMDARDLATAYAEALLALSTTTLTDFKLEVVTDEEDRSVIDHALLITLQFPQLEHLAIVGADMAINHEELPVICRQLHHLKQLRSVALLLDTDEDTFKWNGTMIDAARDQTFEFVIACDHLETIVWHDTGSYKLEFHVHRSSDAVGDPTIHASYANWMEEDHISALGTCLVDRNTTGCVHHPA